MAETRVAWAIGLRTNTAWATPRAQAGRRRTSPADQQLEVLDPTDLGPQQRTRHVRHPRAGEGGSAGDAADEFWTAVGGPL